MSSYKICQGRRICGEIAVPGDKSLSHRVAMVAAIADGTSRLINFSTSLDCQSTLDCLRALGVRIERVVLERGDGATRGHGDTETRGSGEDRRVAPSPRPIIPESPCPHVEIEGVGLTGLRSPDTILDAGNSGSTIRMLSGILAGQGFESIITGDESLRRRPMDRIVRPLRLMGAEIIARDDRYPPLAIRGGELRPIEYALPVASAQVKSCLLLAGLFASGVTAVEEPAPTRNHTEIMLSEFGAQVNVADRVISVVGRPKLSGREYRIAGDPSSAAFFVAAALALPGSRLVLRDVLINPTRTGFLDVIKDLGAPVKIENIRNQHGEPVADLRVDSGSVRMRSSTEPLALSGEIIPSIIDEIPILAVLSTQTGGLIVRDAAELRVKESDRIRLTVENLRRLGANVSEFDDGMTVAGGQKLRGAEIDPGGDHRIAMAFAIGGLFADGETVIRDSDVVGISFPDFFQLLEGIVER